MESLVREANTREELKDVDFERFKQYYQSGEGQKLNKISARSLLNFLLSKTGEKTDSSVNPELKPKAKAALRLVFYFLTEDEAFQEQFERLSTFSIARKLKLERHIIEGPEEHRRMCCRMIWVLTTRFRKFSNWRNYVRAPAHDLVLKGLAEVLATPETQPNAAGAGAGARLPPPGQYYESEVSEVLDLFTTVPNAGLTDDDAAFRRTRYGNNSLPKPPPPSLLKMLLFQLTDFMVVILMVVGFLELVLTEFVPATVLGLVVFFNVVIGFLQELKAQRALRALETLQVPKATVVRDGEQMMLPSEDLVPGDIVMLDEGNQVPADMRLVEAINLQLMEALLTGEPIPVEKSTAPVKQRHVTPADIKNMAFMGTSVVRGRGVGVVTATGKSTEVGKISKALSKKEEGQTLLQRQLRWLGKLLVVVAVVLCIVVVSITLTRLGLKGHLNWSHVRETVEVGVSLGVSVIPEGLVAVVTITMALGVQRMAAENAIVKRLAVVESLGSITVICSDKTGTLTEGKMKAEQLQTAGLSIKFTGSGACGEGDLLDVAGNKLTKDNFPDALQRCLMCCALCNNSSITFNEETSKWDQTGDPTEVAILAAALKGGLPKPHWVGLGWTFEDEVAFDSDRKCMSVLYSFRKTAQAALDGKGKYPATEEDSQLSTSSSSRTILLSKGAPEAIIKKCTRRLTSSGARDQLQAADVTQIDHDALEMASHGLRVLALAYRPMASDEVKNSGAKLETFETELVFLGLIGLIDPPRMEVRDAIDHCKEAGIKVCMITGDHPLTALAIAQQLGIAEKGDEKCLLKGSDLDAVSDQDIDLLSTLSPFPTVFARVSPQHKLKIVQALKLRNEICAMTGDGVNDAPAIKQSNVGVAMGLSGTDLTKDAADIILLDDNFGTIVSAIKEGRHIYDNIKKFILYLLSCNSAEIYVMLLCGIIDLPTPFSAIMILWVNLVADIPPALSLGADPAEPDIMVRLPRDPRKNLFNLKTIGLLLYQGFSMSALTVIVYALFLYLESPDSLKLAYGGEEQYLAEAAAAAAAATNSLDSTSTSSTSTFDLAAAQHGLLHGQTLALVSLTFMQIVHAFLSRSVRNTVFTKHIFNNYWLVGGCLLSSVLMICGVYIPYVNTLLGQVELNLLDWGKILIVCIIHVAVVELFKLAMRLASKCRFTKYEEAGKPLFYDDV